MKTIDQISIKLFGVVFADVHNNVNRARVIGLYNEQFSVKWMR